MKKYQTSPELNGSLLNKSSRAFSTASTLGKVIRSSLSPILYGIQDETAHSRLLKILMPMVKGNTEKETSINNASLSRLKGFQFNARASLNAIFIARNSVETNRDKGQVIISIPSFTPILELRVPAAVTHYQFVTACVEMDFELQRFQVSTAKSGECINYSGFAAPLSLQHSITPGSILPIFIAYTIKFYQEHSGSLYPLANRTSNGVQLLEVDTIKLF